MEKDEKKVPLERSKEPTYADDATGVAYVKNCQKKDGTDQGSFRDASHLCYIKLKYHHSKTSVRL